MFQTRAAGERRHVDQPATADEAERGELAAPSEAGDAGELGIAGELEPLQLRRVRKSDT